MSERRLILKGALAEKQGRKTKLMLDAQRLITELDVFTAHANTRKLEELDTAPVVETAKGLHDTVAAYREVLAEIKKIEDELG